MSQIDRGDLPPELGAVADQLRSHRYEASPLELDQTKTRILKRAGGRQAAGGSGMRKKSLLTAVIMLAALGTGSAAALAVTGFVSSTTPIIGFLHASKPAAAARSAAVVMYGDHTTTTSVTCSPGTLTLPDSTTCVATVTAPGQPEAPTGIVSFGANQGGSFSAGTCHLVEIGGNQSRCSVTFTPHHTGTTKIYADYSGDTFYAPSHASTTITVTGADMSTTTVGCSPSTFMKGDTTTCTATVTGGSHPTGTVTFASNVGGTFSPSATCTLVLIGGNQARCSVMFTPRHKGSVKVYANYSGDGSNPPSHGSTKVKVT